MDDQQAKVFDQDLSTLVNDSVSPRYGKRQKLLDYCRQIKEPTISNKRA